MKDRKNQLKHINPDELKALSLIDKMKAIGIWQRGDRILENVCQPFDLPAQREIAQSAIAQLQQTISIAQQIHDFSKGLGLSAPQIGLPLQVAIVAPLGEESVVLLNPRVVSQSKEIDEQYEGCWSFFNMRGIVPRSLEINIAYQTLDGEELQKSFTQAAARLAAHELDHLQGALYTARMKPGQLLLTYEEYKEKSQPWKYPKDSI